jgi:hypothetical protein
MFFHYGGKLLCSSFQNIVDDEIFRIMQDKTNLYTTQQINKKEQDGLLKKKICILLYYRNKVFSAIIIHVFVA